MTAPEPGSSRRWGGGIAWGLLAFLVVVGFFVRPGFALLGTWLLMFIADPRWQRPTAGHTIVWMTFGLGALLYAGPAWVVEGASASSLLTSLQVGLAFAVLGCAIAWRPARPWVGGAGHRAGVVVGALAMAAFSTFLVVAGAARAQGWDQHPNLWAALAVCTAIAGLTLFARGVRAWAWILVAACSVYVPLLAGSRTALLAGLAGLVVLALQRVGAGAPRRQAVWAAVGGLLVVGSLAVLAFGRTSGGQRWLAWGAQPSTNLVLASEALTASPWVRVHVDVAVSGTQDGQARFRIAATAANQLARLHQRVFLQPGATYALTVEYAPATPPDAGIHAFTEGGGRISVRRTGEVEVLRAPPTLLEANVIELDDGWVRLTLTMGHTGPDPLTWRFGIAPSLLGVAGQVVEVRHVRLNAGDEALPYAPTTLADRTQALASLSAEQRLGYVAATWAIMPGHGWFGHGPSADFATLVRAHDPTLLGPSDNPSHPHSLPLTVLVHLGSIGLIGLSLMAFSVVALAPPGRRQALLPVGAAAVVLNLGDVTLFSGGTAYVVLAMVIWLHASWPRTSTQGDPITP